MSYTFDETIFKQTFHVKETDEKAEDTLRLKHAADKRFKIFPFKASNATKVPIVYQLEEVVCSFFRLTMDMETKPILLDEICEQIKNEIGIEDHDFSFFKEMIRSMFFKNHCFTADHFGLYPYQTQDENKSIDQIAQFMFDIFGLNADDCSKIKSKKETYSYHVLEKILMDTMQEYEQHDLPKDKPYFCMIPDVQKKFKEDFYFMLDTEMTNLEDLADLFSLYYLYYIAQTCITLDQFCAGNRCRPVKFYFALDWERVSRNRQCCVEGWNALSNNLSHMFTHAVTLEIINQCSHETVYDYINLAKEAASSIQEDQRIAQEIIKAEALYRSYVGDYTQKFTEIKMPKGISQTDQAIQHLFKCVEMQFLDTKRNRANQAYNQKFIDYCKNRWVKNRRKAGLVFNLTESDIIFLTKIAIKDREKIRLIDLYQEYAYRGIYLDHTSKEYLQEFFTKLNLIDKKSDSGDAQYVKRIL